MISQRLVIEESKEEVAEDFISSVEAAMEKLEENMKQELETFVSAYIKNKIREGKDEEFIKNFNKEEKTLTKCVKYIFDIAKTNAKAKADAKKTNSVCVAMSDAEVEQAIEEYIKLDEEELKKKKKKQGAKAKAEAEEERKKKEAEEKEKKKKEKEEQEKKEAEEKRKKELEESQMSLFD